MVEGPDPKVATISLSTICKLGSQFLRTFTEVSGSTQYTGPPYTHVLCSLLTTVYRFLLEIPNFVLTLCYVDDSV